VRLRPPYPCYLHLAFELIPIISCLMRLPPLASDSDADGSSSLAGVSSTASPRAPASRPARPTTWLLLANASAVLLSRSPLFFLPFFFAAAATGPGGKFAARLLPFDAARGATAAARAAWQIDPDWYPASVFYFSNPPRPCRRRRTLLRLAPVAPSSTTSSRWAAVVCRAAPISIRTAEARIAPATA